MIDERQFPIDDRIPFMSKKWTADNVHLALKEIKIASPCHVTLDKMEDRGKCFYCNDCKLNVYHFSNLNSAEIAILLNENNEKLCIGMFKREDGTVITKDCPLGLADLGLVYRQGGFLKAASFLILVVIGTGITAVMAEGYLRKETQEISRSAFGGAMSMRDDISK